MNLTQQEWVSENAACLANKIIDHMADNGLTLEVLDESCEIVEKVFRTDAVLKRRPVNTKDEF